MPSPVDFTQLGGWLGIDVTQQAQAANIPLYGDVGPLLMAEPTKPILLYKAWTQVLGKQPDYAAQVIGSCVGHSHAHANDLLQCVEIALGEPNEYRETDAEFLYAESRKVAGILGRWDGSYGAAAVKAMTKVGVVSREMLGKNGADSGQRAKSWGYYGPPAEIEAMAAPYKLGAVAKITTRAAAISCLWNGSPFTICSNQGFTMARGPHGECQPRGRWAHAMSVAAFDPDLERYLIVQSWGPDTPSGPLYLDQPTFTFWVDAGVVERNILTAGDSWGLFAAPDFKPRKLPSEFHRGD